MTNEKEREATRASIVDMERDKKNSACKVKDAANQILEVSSRLHLTLDEFDRAVALFKKCAHISQ